MHDCSLWKGGVLKNIDEPIYIANQKVEQKENGHIGFYSSGFINFSPISVDASPFLEFNITIFVCLFAVFCAIELTIQK